MKKLALFLLLLCCATQVSAGLVPKFKLGVKAGLDYQANDFKSAISNFDIKSSTGWFAGAVADLNWGKLGVHPEVIYSRNSFSVEGADGRLKVSQVEVPVLLNYRVLNIFDLQVGPRFCVLDEASGSSENIEWNWKNPTVGYAIGVEAMIWKLAISARFNGSFKSSEVMGFTTGTSKTNNVQIGVGYYF